ncbi:FG-GAP-like repeat-containing protein, partial [Candidatus Marithioploca araucensis]|nr:FG-GAP-like repeat-containing protein [Candidatus Marithioploca araucensis]
SSEEGATEESSEEGATEESSEEGATEESSEEGATEESSEEGATEESSEEGATEESSEEGATEESSEEGATEESSEEGATEEGSEEGATEESSEEGATEEGSEEGATEESSEEGATEEGSEESTADEDDTGEAGETTLGLATLEGNVLDESDNPIEGATITLEGVTVTLESEITVTTDDKGYYNVPDLSLGTYTLKVTMEGFVFQESQVTLLQNEKTVTINLTSVAGGTIQGRDMIVVGEQACEVNSIALLEANGEIVHKFGVNDTDKDNGIRISIADFDLDESSDIVITEDGKGNKFFLYNGKGHHKWTIIKPDGNDKGVNAAFGDVVGSDDGVPEIMVANQDEDTLLGIYQAANGKVIHGIQTFEEKTGFNIAAGNVNDDGTDEIIVVKATQAENENVFVYSSDGSKGTLLTSFTALLGEEARGMVVATGDVDGDGVDEIVLGQASNAEEYMVGVYKMDGTPVGDVFDAFNRVEADDGSDESGETESGDTESGESGDTESSEPVSCNYDGKGVVLAVGDVNGDGSAEIIVSKAGGSEVRIYSLSEGEWVMIASFTAVSEGSVITALGFATNLILDLPMTTELPDEPVLKDLTIVGTEDAPVEVTDRTVEGTVRFNNAVIKNLKVGLGARAVFGPGVLFVDKESIPVGSELTKIFPIIRINSVASKLNADYEAVNLSTNVIKDKPPVLEDVKELLPGTTVEQSPETGNLEVALGGPEGDEFIYEVSPYEVIQVDEPEGVVLNPDNSVKVVTKHGQCIKGNAVSRDLPGLVIELTSDAELDASLNMDMQGVLMQSSNLYPDYLHVGRADILSTVVEDDSVRSGRHRADHPRFGPGNKMLYTHVFQKCKKKKGKKCKKGKKRRQKIYPCPVYPRILRTGLDLRTSNVINVNVKLDGSMSFKFKSKSTFRLRQGVLGYRVRRGRRPGCGCTKFAPTYDINRDGVEDFNITYPDGYVQDLLMIRE